MAHAVAVTRQRQKDEGCPTVHGEVYRMMRQIGSQVCNLSYRQQCGWKQVQQQCHTAAAQAHEDLIKNEMADQAKCPRAQVPVSNQVPACSHMRLGNSFTRMGVTCGLAKANTYDSHRLVIYIVSVVRHSVRPGACAKRAARWLGIICFKGAGRSLVAQRDSQGTHMPVYLHWCDGTWLLRRIGGH